MQGAYATGGDFNLSDIYFTNATCVKIAATLRIGQDLQKPALLCLELPWLCSRSPGRWCLTFACFVQERRIVPSRCFRTLAMTQALCLCTALQPRMRATWHQMQPSFRPLLKCRPTPLPRRRLWWGPWTRAQSIGSPPMSRKSLQCLGFNRLESG